MNWLEGLLLEESCIIYIKLTEPDAILQDFCKQPGQKLHLWNTSEATRNEQVQLRAGCGPKREKCRFISNLTTRWADSQATRAPARSTHSFGIKARGRHPCKLQKQKEKHQCQAKTETAYCLDSYKNKVHWKAYSDDVNFNKRHWQNEGWYLNAGWSADVFRRCKMAREVILWEDR